MFHMEQFNSRHDGGFKRVKESAFRSPHSARSNLGAVNFELGMLALFLRENDINLGTLPYGARQFDFGTVQKRGVFDN